MFPEFYAAYMARAMAKNRSSFVLLGVIEGYLRARIVYAHSDIFQIQPNDDNYHDLEKEGGVKGIARRRLVDPPEHGG